MRVAHEHDRAYRVEDGGSSLTIAGHASGRFAIDSAAGRSLLVLRDFWERYPKAVRCDSRSVAVELFPALGGVELPDYERECWRCRSLFLINHMLAALGLKPIYFMADTRWFRRVHIIFGICQDIGFGAIIYLAALRRANPELYDTGRATREARDVQARAAPPSTVMAEPVIMSAASEARKANASAISSG